MSGAPLASEIRATRGPALPIVLLVSLDHMHEAQTLPVSGYVTKPAKTRDLAKALAAAITGRDASQVRTNGAIPAASNGADLAC